MHELGVVFNVIKEVEAVAAENGAEEILAVTLELGEVSTVIPYYLKDCWEWAIKRTERLKNAELRIETIPAVTFCEDCRSEYETVKYGKICPHCGCDHTFLLQGNEFVIKEISVAEDSADVETAAEGKEGSGAETAAEDV